MKIEVKMVSPAMAEALLATNPINREVSHARVMALANAMRMGKWQLNGETIIVSETGKLLDGQHRLYAVTEFGGHVQMMIAYGAPDNAFETIDTGRARSAGDIAGMKGVAAPKLSTAAAGLIWRAWHQARITEPCAPHMALKVIERYPAIQKWALHVQGVGRGLTLPGASHLAALVYLEDIALKPRSAERFFAGISRGADLKDGDPILALRNRMITYRAAGGVLQATTTWAPTARALTAMEAGETIQKLAIERLSGITRRPALWEDHVQALPKSKSLDDLLAPNLMGGQDGKNLRETVKELRAMAADAIAEKAKKTA